MERIFPCPTNKRTPASHKYMQPKFTKSYRRSPISSWVFSFGPPTTSLDDTKLSRRRAKPYCRGVCTPKFRCSWWALGCYSTVVFSLISTPHVYIRVYVPSRNHAPGQDSTIKYSPTYRTRYSSFRDLRHKFSLRSNLVNGLSNRQNKRINEGIERSEIPEWIREDWSP